MDENYFRTWVTVIYFTSSIIILLISVLFFYFVLRKILKFFTNSNVIFGDSASARLISLGIATLFFYDVVQEIFSAVLNIISAYFIDGSKSIVNIWQTNISNCRNYYDDLCIGQLSSGYFVVMTTAFSKSLDSISSISIYRVILFVALWSLIAIFINFAQQTQQNSTGSPNINNWFRFIYINRNTVTAKNIAFALILIIGGYLSVAAIAAIPGLQEKSATFQEVSPERLKTQIDEMIATMDKYPAEAVSKDPFIKITSLIGEQKKSEDKIANGQNLNAVSNTTDSNTAISNSNANISVLNSNSSSNKQINIPPTNSNTEEPSKANQKVNNPVIKKESIDYIENFIGNRQRERQSLIGLYKDLLDSAKSQQKSAKNLAIQSYEAGNLDRKGNKERVKYFLDITEWFNRRASSYDSSLTGCLNSIKNLDLSWESQLDNIVGELKNNNDDENAYLYPDHKRFNDSLNIAFAECPYSVGLNETFPTRPQLGDSSYLGPFSFVASWLLRTESLPLTLITGLLGFGLLGSACSTFIRERIGYKGKISDEISLTGSNQNRQLVHDLTGVVIRGVSAAVVVFLAVVGGLAIFSSGNNEPNPYVLLLTCLIAAVFSETVWEWAQQELASKFKAKESEEDTEKDDSNKDDSANS